MSQGRWKSSEEAIAIEAFAVLIKRQKPTRTYSKSDLISGLTHPSTYAHFLKICLEHDDTHDLKQFRQGLLIVIKAVGPSYVARATGLTRMTLYRMLSKGGNPRLGSLISLFEVLGLRLW